MQNVSDFTVQVHQLQISTSHLCNLHWILDQNFASKLFVISQITHTSKSDFLISTEEIYTWSNECEKGRLVTNIQHPFWLEGGFNSLLFNLQSMQETEKCKWLVNTKMDQKSSPEIIHNYHISFYLPRVPHCATVLKVFFSVFHPPKKKSDCFNFCFSFMNWCGNCEIK